MHWKFKVRHLDDSAFAGRRFGKLEAHHIVGAALDQIAAAGAAQAQVRTNQPQVVGLGQPVVDVEGSCQLAEGRAGLQATPRAG